MAGVIYYVQECPTCGRNLQVRIEYLGKRVTCQHCSAQFEAIDPSSDDELASSSSTLLDRADQLLETASKSGIGLRDNT